MSVHGFVREVATCLLHLEDVEVGDLKNGKFVRWPLEPLEVDEKIDTDLLAMDEFLDDKTRYVFRKKQSASPVT
jgi:hypothetical protein